VEVIEKHTRVGANMITLKHKQWYVTQVKSTHMDGAALLQCFAPLHSAAMSSL